MKQLKIIALKSHTFTISFESQQGAFPYHGRPSRYTKEDGGDALLKVQVSGDNKKKTRWKGGK